MSAPEDTARDLRHVVCPAEELPAGRMRAFTLGARRILVVGLPGGEYNAVADFCPHQRGPLSGGSLERMWLADEANNHVQSADRWVLICPFHNFEMDARTGCPVVPIGRSRAATYPVAVEDGQIVVYLRKSRRT
ncbi:MAG TPA: Rieske (2Fe-2S) protein [Pilimelia sp.]|nr:Rieske (2Fe-2S) protein [Pilimelia sp.]